jgi:peptidylprolyl isomerase
MKAPMLTIAVCAALALAGCGGGDESSDAAPEATATTGEPVEKTKPRVAVPQGAPPKKLETRELESGSGAEAKPRDEVTVQYVGVGYESGEEFDSSWSRNEPFSFTLGAGEVIPGWDQGVEGMKVGGRRELVIPPELAYGEAGAPPAIGPNETLVFVIDLLEVN